jgi:replicative DNA helicase
LTPEILILKLFLKDRDNYIKYSHIMSTLILDKEFVIIYKTIEKYYETIPTHSYIGQDEYTNFFLLHHNTLKDKDIILDLTKQIYNVDVSDSLMGEVIKNLLEKDTCNKIVQKLLPVLSENKFGILSSVEGDLKSYLKLVTKENQDSPFEDTPLEDLLENHVTGEGLHWRLSCLNEDIGVLRPGYLGHMFARTDSGKTSWLCSELSYMAKQLVDDENIIWFGNEENVGRIKLRLYSALLNEPLDRIVQYKDAALEKFELQGGNKIKFVGQIHDIKQIRNICFEYKPKLIVIDSGDKVSFSGDSKYEGANRLGQLYYLYRQLVDEFGLIGLTVGQASAEAAGKKWLEMHMLDNSKTGKPKEMDFIVGLGRTLGSEEDGIRYINIPKNKLIGRNGKFAIKFNPATGRFSNL